MLLEKAINLVVLSLLLDQLVLVGYHTLFLPFERAHYPETLNVMTLGQCKVRLMDLIKVRCSQILAITFLSVYVLPFVKIQISSWYEKSEIMETINVAIQGSPNWSPCSIYNTYNSSSRNSYSYIKYGYTRFSSACINQCNHSTKAYTKTLYKMQKTNSDVRPRPPLKRTCGTSTKRTSKSELLDRIAPEILQKPLFYEPV